MQQQEKNKNNNKGFNLLELLVVISIVGLVSAIAYPNFSEWNSALEMQQLASLNLIYADKDDNIFFVHNIKANDLFFI